jgi:putative ABC transport system permease protein
MSRNPRVKLASPRIDRPLAWAQLSHQKVRLLVAIGGIAFANVLIFMQLGFLALFTEGVNVLPDHLAGDLFLMDPDSKYIGIAGFDRIRLYQAEAIEGVASAQPVYISYISWAYSKDKLSYATKIIAYEPTQEALMIPEAIAQQPKLLEPNTVLFDRTSRDAMGPIADRLAANQLTKEPFVKATANGRKVRAVGLFSLGSSLLIGDGNVIASTETYGTLLGDAALQKVALGVIRLKPGANAESVRLGIKQTVPGVQVFTRASLLAKEMQFQQENPTGPIFGFGTIMGFVVGIVVVYQVLYADVSDHLSEYATLKAIGYSDRLLLLVIFQEAAFLAVLGFAPGCAGSIVMYSYLESLTKLGLIMKLETVIQVFGLTLTMCSISALIASSKLRSADPADVF